MIEVEKLLYSTVMKQLVTKLKMYGWKKTAWFAIYEIKLLIDQLLRNTYSQNQEDLFIDKLLGYPAQGFYVDVGAFDPHRFSNTKRFYDKGWRGINVEPDPQNYKKFVDSRPKDINLNQGVSDKNGTLTFYKMNPGTLSTFSKEDADANLKEGFELIEKVQVKTTTLAEVMKNHVGKQPIDFLSVDTEGLDFTVLNSNDWKKYRPKVVCVESNKGTDIDNSVEKLLISHGYTAVFNNGLNAIYTVKNRIKNS